MALLERAPPRPPPRSASSAGSAGASPVLVAGAAVAGLLAIAPLVYLAIRAAEPGLAGLVEILARPRTMELLGRSVALAGAVTAACMVLGV
ncbi:MAG: iron ABC transporter permease, partial [Pseudonocardiales bacterium]|nr:iron ABC transporter permease [Pseudonocardiales bacterium]